MNFGKEVIVSEFLPVEKMYPATDIITKQEIKIPSGEYIHVIEVPSFFKKDTTVLIVSKEVKESLKDSSLPPQ